MPESINTALIRPIITPIIGSIIKPVLGSLFSPSFYAKLLSDLALTYGSGDATFTRSTTGTVKDYNGSIVTCAIDEARFEGARRIQEGRWSGYGAENTIEFDGDSDDITVGTFDITKYTEITISGWFDLNSISITRMGVTIKHSGLDDIRLYSEANSIRFGLDDGTASIVSSTFVPNLNELYYVVGTFDGTNQKLYVNGKLEDSTTDNFDFSTTDGETHIGSRQGSSRFWDGSIDNVKIFDKALTSSEVIAEYNATRKSANTVANANLVGWWKLDDTDSSITDYSGNGNTGTFNSDGSPATPVNVDGAYDNGVKLTTLKGVLIEEQRENEITYSEDFGTTWSAIGVTLTTDATDAPDGAKTADKIEQFSNPGNDRIEQLITLSASKTYTVSCYFKNINSTQTKFRIRDLNTATILAELLFDWTVQTPSTNTSTGASSINYEELGSDWWRISYNFTTLSVVTTHRVVLFPESSATAVNSVYVWGVQVEEGSFPTSYIKTVASTVTRTKDVLYYSALNNINESQGSMVCDFNLLGFKGFSAVLNINDGSPLNRITMSIREDIQKAYTQVYGQGALQVDLSSPLIYPNIDYSEGVSYKVNDFDYFFDGVKEGEDTLVELPEGLVKINIGSDSANSTQANATIKEVKIYKQKLTDAKMAELTS